MEEEEKCGAHCFQREKKAWTMGCQLIFEKGTYLLRSVLTRKKSHF